MNKEEKALSKEEMINRAYALGREEMKEEIIKIFSCPDCGGSGVYSTPSDYSPCSSCNGTGSSNEGSFNDLIAEI